MKTKSIKNRNAYYVSNEHSEAIRNISSITGLNLEKSLAVLIQFALDNRKKIQLLKNLEG